MDTLSKTITEIKYLQDEIRACEQSEENKRRWSYWQTENIGKDALARLIPGKGVVPFTVELDRSAYAKVLGFSLVDFYREPELYVLNSLKVSLLRFKEFDDCMPISKTVAYFAGSGFEKSLFGGEQVITEQDAWVGRENTVEGRIDFDQLPVPDFYGSAVMQFTHRFCERMREIVDDDFTMEFPQWNRSSWGVAWHLKGIDNLLIDYMEDPEWLAGFLKRINAARMRWTEERCKFLGEKLRPCSLYNDEVTVPVVSPTMYEELILPTEIELSQFYGGMNYWHSCGNTTRLMNKINTIPNLGMVHVSGWSDIKTAASTYSGEKALQISLQPIEDILMPKAPDFVDTKLQEIVDYTGHRISTVAVDALQIVTTVEENMGTIKDWIKHANRILLNKN